MKILVASPFFSTHYDSSWFWLRAFSQLGHSLILWDYRLQPEMPKVDADCSIVFKGESIDPGILPRPRVNYWPDWFGFFPPEVEERVRQYDLVFTPQKTDWTTWLPSGFDPLIHKDLGYPRKVNTLYIGTNNSQYKVDMIKGIAPQYLFGNNWENTGLIAGPPQYLHAFTEVANRAKILVCVHRDPQDGVTRKIFELVRCGFTIIDNIPGVDKVFPDFWAEIAFKSPEEAKIRIQHYLNDEEERNRLWALEKKAIESFSYENCTRKMFECLLSL